MSRIKLTELLPDNKYLVRIRALDGVGNTSEWSPGLEFTTITDTVFPATPQNVEWVVAGDTFEGSWDAVTKNVNDEDITIVRYEIELVADGMTRIDVAMQDTSGERIKYVLTFDKNGAMFDNEAQPAITMRVRAVDNKSLKSAWSMPPLTAVNPPPAAPTDAVVVESINTLDLSWTAPNETDLIGYNVYVGLTDDFIPDHTNRVYSGPTTRFTYTTLTYVTHYFKIRAYDKFKQESVDLVADGQPDSPFVLDSEAPPVPVLAAPTLVNNSNGVGAVANLSWTLPATADLAGYRVRYRKAGTTDAYIERSFSKDVNAGQVELPLAFTDYEFQIRAYDYSANYSAWSNDVTGVAPGNTAPSNVSGLVSVPSVDSIRYSWTPVSDTDIKNYELMITTSLNFTTDNVSFLTGNASTLTVSGLIPQTTYHARVRAVDQQGLASGSWSSVDVKQTLASTLSSLSVSALTTGTIGSSTGFIGIGAGASIVLNGGYLKSNTYTGTSQATNPSGAGFYLGNDGIRIDQGKVNVAALTSGPITGATIELTGSNAYIQSAGWTNGSTTGFRLSEDGLEIPDGSIAASKIAVGDSTPNLMPYAQATMDLPISNTQVYVTGLETGDIVNMDTATFDSSPQSLRIIATGPGQRSIQLAANDSFNVTLPELGEKYILSAYVRPSTTGSWKMGYIGSPGIVLADVTAKRVTDDATTLVADTWQRIYINITEAQANNAVGKIFLTPPTGGGTWHIDSVQLEKQLDTNLTGLPTQWNPPNNTIIDGGQIRTGEIRSTNTVSINGRDEPVWSLPVNGAATFTSARILGSIVVGNGPADADSVVQSSNYQPGTQGWRLNANGLAEFRNVVTGSLSADSIGGGDLLEGEEVELRGAIIAKGRDVNGVLNGIEVGFSADGFWSSGPDGVGNTQKFIDFPTDGKPNIISGLLNTTRLVVEGDASSQSATFKGISRIEEDSQIYLSSSITAPIGPPSVSNTWTSWRLDGVGNRNYAGMTTGHNGNVFVGYSFTHPSGDYDVVGITEYSNIDSSGIQGWDLRQFNTSKGQPNDMPGGGTTADKQSTKVLDIAYVSGMGYALLTQTYAAGSQISQGVNTIRIILYSNSMVKLNEQIVFDINTISTAVSPTLGTDFVNNRLLLGFKSSTNNTVAVLQMEGTSLASAGPSKVLGVHAGQFHLVGFGQFDYSTPRYVLAASYAATPAFYSYDTNGTSVTEEAFLVAQRQNLTGACWNNLDSRFESLTTGRVRMLYEGGLNMWTTPGSNVIDDWWFKYSWYDDSDQVISGILDDEVHESGASPAAKLVKEKRAKVLVATNAIPYTAGNHDSATKALIFRSLDNTSYNRVGTISHPGTTFEMAGSIFLGAGPGSFGSEFPQSAQPAKINGSGLVITGDGDIEAVEGTFETLAVTSYFANGNPLVIATAGQQNPAANQFVVLGLSTVHSRGGGAVVGNIFTAPISGYYQINVQVAWTSNTTGRRLLILEKVQGSPGVGEYIGIADSHGSGDGVQQSNNISVCCYLPQGQGVRGILFHNVPGGLSTVSGNTEFSAYMV